MSLSNTQWRQEAICSAIDDSGQAHITLNDLVDFLGDFGCSLNYRKKMDPEAKARFAALVTPE